MGSGGGSSSGSDTTTIRYAPYVEDRHKIFLSDMYTKRVAAIADSPYAAYSDVDVDKAFLGSGILITSFASLFSTFEDFMCGLDTESLFDTLFDKTLNSQFTKDAIVAEGALLSEDLVTNAYPRMMAGARDLNAVMSSTFVVAKGNLEASRLRNLSKFSASLKYNLLAHANSRWTTTLDWHKQIVASYSGIMQLYFTSKLASDTQNYTMKAKDTLWPFTVLDHERAALGALQGATNTKSVSGEGPSDGAKALGGAMSGAAMGAAVTGGNPIGAAIGGVVGGVAGFLL